jgi:hypothetical protein
MVQQHGNGSSTKHLLYIVLVLQLRLFVGGFLDGGKVSSLLLKIALLLSLFWQFGSLVVLCLEWVSPMTVAWRPSSQDEGAGPPFDHGREQPGEDSPLSV